MDRFPIAQRRYSTGREYLRLLCSHPAHLFRVQLHWIIAQLCLSCCFQVVTSHWEVTVSLHPPGQSNEDVSVCTEASPYLQKGLRHANRTLTLDRTGTAESRGSKSGGIRGCTFCICPNALKSWPGQAHPPNIAIAQIYSIPTSSLNDLTTGREAISIAQTDSHPPKLRHWPRGGNPHKNLLRQIAVSCTHLLSSPPCARQAGEPGYGPCPTTMA